MWRLEQIKPTVVSQWDECHVVGVTWVCEMGLVWWWRHGMVAARFQALTSQFLFVAFWQLHGVGSDKVSLNFSPLTLFVLPLSFYFLFFFCFSVWSLESSDWWVYIFRLTIFFFLDLHVGWLAGSLVHNFGGGSSYKVRRPNSFLFFLWKLTY